jgi:MFS family permease
MSGRYSWYVVAVLLLANVSGFIDRQILALLVVPIKRDLGLTDTEMSYLIGLPFAIFYTVAALPIARVADSWSRRGVIATGIALWSVMTAMCGLAGSYGRLLLARVGVGVGEAALAAPATSIIADYFPRQRLGTAMSVYSMGVFLGSGLAYFIGGWIVGLVSVQETWSFPLIGSIRPWQTVFLMVGLPGLLIAALTLTIREPERTGGRAATPPLSRLFAHVRANRRTFACVSFGYALSATVNYGIAFWLATFLQRTYDWPASRAGMVQGVLTVTLGTVGVLAGGRIADALVRRGHPDGALRVGLIGATGMLVFASAYPLASTATIAITLLAIVNVFAALPWGAASAAAAEIVPADMRAQGVALFYFVTNLVSFALGPWAVAAITQYAFGYDAAVRYSLVTVNVLGMAGAITLLLLALPAFRRTIADRGMMNQR